VRVNVSLEPAAQASVGSDKAATSNHFSLSGLLTGYASLLILGRYPTRSGLDRA
jgi:hypothetical protein